MRRRRFLDEGYVIEGDTIYLTIRHATSSLTPWLKSKAGFFYSCVDGYDIKAGIRELEEIHYRVRVYEGHASDGNFLFEGSPDE
ncbi:MAG: hypothetical protein WAX07_00670 [Candidatus Altiarchaeia archaeon]